MVPSIDRAKNAIDKSLADRDNCVDMFFSSLDRDIKELLHDMKEAKQAINVSQNRDVPKPFFHVLNANSNLY